MNTTPCSVSAQCQSGPEFLTERRAHCPMCKFADDNGGPEHHWRPLTPTRHPKAVEAKQKAIREKKQAEQAKLANRDPAKRYYSKRAAGAEQKTNTALARYGVKIAATRNSGRSCQDGDHLVQFGSTVPLQKLTLDTKMQSQVDHPKVLLNELDKVREDAKRAGSLAGALLLRNKFGRGVVVFAEEDFSQLFS